VIVSEETDIDTYFPRVGLCACCSTQDGRHRVIDAIAERYGAGDSIELLAEDYGVSADAVLAAARHSTRPRELRDEG
jgi:hypothetical protein